MLFNLQTQKVGNGKAATHTEAEQRSTITASCTGQY